MKTVQKSNSIPRLEDQVPTEGITWNGNSLSKLGLDIFVESVCSSMVGGEFLWVT